MKTWLRLTRQASPEDLGDLIGEATRALTR
jgi:hypothetical protein